MTSRVSETCSVVTGLVPVLMVRSASIRITATCGVVGSGAARTVRLAQVQVACTTSGVCSTAAHPASVINGRAGAHSAWGRGQVMVNQTLPAATAAGSTGMEPDGALPGPASGAVPIGAAVGLAALDSPVDCAVVGSGSKNSTRTSRAIAITT